MKSTLIIFGSSTGYTDTVAGTIASKLGLDNSAIVNITDLDAAQVAEAEVLLLGSSTWGDGDMQDDWYDGIKTVKGADLSGKLIGFFGCGDCESYPDTFCGALGKLYHELETSGATFIGAVPTDGYTFDDSEAVVDGQFVGCAIDDTNEDDKTEERINTWIAALRPHLG
ncbi:MAG: flavodoxin FldA [Bacteroidales bacterium]|nr:flavodoxin FldA [Bacteroidales bacterium]